MFFVSLSHLEGFCSEIRLNRLIFLVCSYSSCCVVASLHDEPVGCISYKIYSLHCKGHYGMFNFVWGATPQNINFDLITSFWEGKKFLIIINIINTVICSWLKLLTKHSLLNTELKTILTLSLPDMHICVNFSTVYNDMLVEKGLNLIGR